MNRRNFLKGAGGIIATICLPITILNYDPVSQKVITPKRDNSMFNGYKGPEFFECGYVYCPHLPLFTTNRLTII